jgi:C4-dicarboxylate transporter, DctM subunit
VDPYLIGLGGVIVLIGLLALGTHVGIALTVSGFAGLLYMQGFERALVTSVSSMYGKISSTALVTLPLFILVGFLASGGGISRDLYKSLDLLIGRFKSGLGIATVLGCTAFGTVCGSSLVTAAVFAKISAPEMRKRGYASAFAYGICAASGSIGMLIPPSILAIVYGMLSGVSIGKLLIAGIVPGLMWALLFVLTIFLVGRFMPSWISSGEPGPSIPWRQRVATLLWWWPILLSGGIIFGGIYGGVFTPTEASAVAAFVLFLLYIYRALTRRKELKVSKRFGDLYEMLTDTALTSAMIFFVLGGATVFSNFAVLTGLTTKFTDFVIGLGLSPLGIMVMFCFVYLILGCFLDSISMLCMTISLFNPIIDRAGIDPIWYAVIVILTIEMGFITPPFGINLFAVLGVAEKDLEMKDLIKGSAPFLVAEFVSLLIFFSFPALATYLPSFVG